MLCVVAPSLSTADLSDLPESWQLSLRVDRKSPATLKGYGEGVRAYLAWCEDQGSPPLERGTVRGWVAHRLDAGAKPATARARQLAVRRFTAWLADEGEIDADPFIGVKPPVLGKSSGRPTDIGHTKGSGVATRSSGPTTWDCCTAPQP
jgi:site-specific recombinase XerC